MMTEEEHEYESALKADDWNEQVDAICDQIVLTVNQAELELDSPAWGGAYLVTSTEPYVFGKDNRNFFLGKRDSLTSKLIELGVVPDLAMKQVVKHISSRVIDPDKEADWNVGKIDKWPKWKQQPAETIYEPNYNLCRAKQSY